ncbi:MAG: hypothetical protein HUK10_03745 [Bacteroides heparinolyticus]|nr:hypothetical protein [Bacteroides heparinolyticus]
MELKIYNRSGALKLTISTSSSSTWNQELMSENVLSVSFTHTSYVPLEVNDYAVLEGIKFSVKKEYKPKQKNRQTYSYSVKLYAPVHDAEQVKYLYLTDGEYNPQFSLDGTPREHLQKWVDNMNRISGSPQWSVGDVIVASRKTIDYNNTSCWEALGKMADAFDTEWWTDGSVINLSRCEHGERIPLGYLKGLTSLTQAENSDSVKFFTRLIPLGSTRNIDRSRYGFSRLQLPGREKYIDRNMQYGLYEHVEEAAFANIFPHYTGAVTSVRSVQKKDNNGKPFIIYYFKDSGMPFDPNSYELPGLKKRVSFQSGDLNGHGSDDNGTYYFEADYDSMAEEWEIITLFPDETRQLPGGNLIPRVGDKYIPWNIRMPEAYETQAEQDYLAAVNGYLEKHSQDVSKYGGDTDYIYVEENSVPIAIGQNVRLLSDEYFPDGYRDSRMTKIVRKLDNLSLATIECADSVGKGWKRQVDSGLSQLKYVLERQQENELADILKSWDGREATDYRLMTALRIIREIEKKALSKEKSDRTEHSLEIGGRLTVERLFKALTRLEVGEAVDSLIAGKGIIAENGVIQADRMELRGSLTVLEVIFNRLSAMEGDYSFSESGTIDRIEPLSDGTYTLYLRKRWENDFTAFEERDIIYGVVNNLASGEGEYYTSWMRVLHVDTAANTVSVVLYPNSEVPGGKNYPPEPLMVCTRRGNPVNQDRQAYWYLSTYEHCICMLDGVTKPILEEENYSIIIGRLKHLSLFDNLPINYKQSYVYCRGMAIQDILRIDYQGNPVRSENNRGKWNAQEAVSNPYKSSQEVYDAVYHYGCKWMCLVNGTTKEPKYSSSDWAMIEGNPDFTIEVKSSNGWYFDMDDIVRLYNNGQQPFTVLNLIGRLYNRDVTAHILDSDIEWTRDSGNVTEDNAWAVTHADTGKVLPLTLNDLGPNYTSMRRCSFKATVLLRDGSDTYTEDYTIEF